MTPLGEKRGRGLIRQAGDTDNSLSVREAQEVRRVGSGIATADFVGPEGSSLPVLDAPEDFLRCPKRQRKQRCR